MNEYMKVISAAQMRDIDARMIREYGVSGEALMERAGCSVANCVRDLARSQNIANPSVLFVAGKGNNGGDAFVAARILAGCGATVELWLATEAAQVAGYARTYMDQAVAAGIPVKEMPSEKDWDDAIDGCVRRDVIVDGLLGTGFKGPVHGVIRHAIMVINYMSARSLVVAIDIPSGLDADSGMPHDEAVVADVTVTMGLPKHGLVSRSGVEYTGSLLVAEIGIPPSLIEELPWEAELVEASGVSALFMRRPRESHKGSYGHLLIAGGSAGYSGAVIMAAKGALRSGVGLVTAFVPHSISSVVAAGVQEAMVRGMAEGNAGVLSSGALLSVLENVEKFDAILVGPGMGTDDQCRLLVLDLIRRCRTPLVIDADALNVQKVREHILPAAACPVVITPHPGELARFLGSEVETIQADRLRIARETAETTNTTVLLKGAGSVIAEAGRIPAINMSGNPGMATGGTGDVLAGVVGGLLAQGLGPFDAACAAAYLHGRAGDRAAWRLSQAGMVAGDVIDGLPSAFREVCGR